MLLDLGAGKLLSIATDGVISDSTINEMIEKWGREMGQKLDGKWEGAVRKIVLKIAARTAKKAKDDERVPPDDKVKLSIN